MIDPAADPATAAQTREELEKARKELLDFTVRVCLAVHGLCGGPLKNVDIQRVHLMTRMQRQSRTMDQALASSRTRDRCAAWKPADAQ